MMRNVYLDNDADLSILNGKTISVIGFGNQGSAQAQNLRDSGLEVIIGNIDDEYALRAKQMGFKVYSIREATEKGDIIMMLIPDEVQPDVYEHSIKDGLRPGKTLVFASGYNIHFGYIKPPNYVDVVMLAPRMIGSAVRSLYLKGSGAPALIAINRDFTGTALQTLLAIAKGIGSTRAGVIESTFEEETIIDLFSEQALAYGQLIKLAFEVLTEAGFDPVVVALELYASGEIVEISKAIVNHGLVNQLSLHSLTSQYGQLSRANIIFNEEIKKKMKNILEDIVSGNFAKEWYQEGRANYPSLNKLLEQAKKHPIVEYENMIHKKFKIYLL
jgi:ketol-acid reductoisomerase